MVPINVAIVVYMSNILILFCLCSLQMSSSASATHRKRAVHYIMEFLREEQLWGTLEAMEKEWYV